MNTILAGTRLTARAAEAAQRILTPAEEGRCRQADSKRIKVLGRAQVATAPRTGNHPGTRALWLRSEVDVRVEKLMLLLLAVAAVIGITYGFSCLMDLVQNWAVMERGIANLI